MKKIPVYRELACLIAARNNCAKSANNEWYDKHEEHIEWIVKQFMPHGSGFDAGTKLDLEASTSEKLVFVTAYHHMNENGMYGGWTEHKVTVRPSLAFDYQIKITGRDRNQIKDYMHECFDCALCDICRIMGAGRNEYGWYFGEEWKKAEIN